MPTAPCQLQLRAGRSAQRARDRSVWVKVTGAPGVLSPPPPPFSWLSAPLGHAGWAPCGRTSVRRAGLAVRAGAGRGPDSSEAAQTQGRSALGCGNGRPGCTRMFGRPHAIFAKSPQRDLSETPLSRAPATSHTCQLKLKLIHFKIKLKGGWTASGVCVPAPPPRPIARQAAMAVSFPLSFSVPRASAPCALSSAPPGPRG